MFQRFRAQAFKRISLKDESRLWLVFLILMPWLLNTIRQPNDDYGIVSATVRDWAAGGTALYAPGSVYYNYTPWMLLVYFPLSYIPHPYGQLIFNLISISLLIWATWYFVKPVPWWMMALTFTTIYTGMLIIQGQWDAFVLASLILGCIAVQRKNPWLMGIAMIGMTTKYTNVILPMLLLLYAIRAWPIKKIIYAAIIPFGTLLGSFLVAGWDWPLRYFKLLQVTVSIFQQVEFNTSFSNTVYKISYRLIQPPLGITLVTILAVISLYFLLRIVRRGISLEAVSLSVAINLLISPYITFHHMIYLAPLQVQLFKQHRAWGLCLFGAAIIDLLFLYLGIGLIIYPIVALIIIIILILRGSLRPEENAIQGAA